jgi:hypothetical protein
MHYLKIVDGVPTNASARELRIDNPDVSFPLAVPVEMYADYGFYPYVVAGKPSFNPKNQTVALGAFVQLADGSWEQPWIVNAIRVEDWRETHSIPIKDFCLNLFDAGRLPFQEAVDAGRGIWPATFNAGLGRLTERQKVSIQLEFAVADSVRRNHQMIALLKQLSVVVNGVTKPPMTDEEVDTMFGWVAP